MREEVDFEERRFGDQIESFNRSEHNRRPEVSSKRPHDKAVIWFDPKVNNEENQMMQTLFKVEKYTTPKGKEVEGGYFNTLFEVEDCQKSGNLVFADNERTAL